MLSYPLIDPEPLGSERARSDRRVCPAQSGHLSVLGDRPSRRRRDPGDRRRRQPRVGLAREPAHPRHRLDVPEPVHEHPALQHAPARCRRSASPQRAAAHRGRHRRLPRHRPSPRRRVPGRPRDQERRVVRRWCARAMYAAGVTTNCRLSTVGDPFGGPKRPHDARLNGNVLTMMDNRAATDQPSRAVAYRITRRRHGDDALADRGAERAERWHARQRAGPARRVDPRRLGRSAPADVHRVRRQRQPHAVDHARRRSVSRTASSSTRSPTSTPPNSGATAGGTAQATRRPHPVEWPGVGRHPPRRSGSGMGFGTGCGQSIQAQP